MANSSLELPPKSTWLAIPMTYSDQPTQPFNSLLDVAPLAEDLPITQTLARNGAVGSDSLLASYGVFGSYLDQTTGHRVASVFWDYLNSTGLIASTDGPVEGLLFEPWFFATGLPITEAYWSRVKVADVVQDVLTQCFERRCLTYTPANELAWRVEMGNVGLHYYSWRYPEVPGPPEPPVEPEPPETPTPPERGDPTFTAGFDVWGDATIDSGSRTIIEDGYLLAVNESGTELGVLVPQVIYADNIVEANVQVLNGNESGAYCVVVRRDALSGAHYRGCVTTSGDVKLSYLSSGGADTLVSEQGRVTAGRLAEGVDIAVLSQGSTFWLEIDGEIVGSAEHTARAEGSSGMIAIGVGEFLVTTYVVYDLE